MNGVLGDAVPAAGLHPNRTHTPGPLNRTTLLRWSRTSSDTPYLSCGPRNSRGLSLGNLCSTRLGHIWKSCGNLGIGVAYWKGDHTPGLCERGKSIMTHKKKKICDSVGYMQMQGLLSSLQWALRCWTEASDKDYQCAWGRANPEGNGHEGRMYFVLYI